MYWLFIILAYIPYNFASLSSVSCLQHNMLQACYKKPFLAKIVGIFS